MPLRGGIGNISLTMRQRPSKYWLPSYDCCCPSTRTTHNIISVHANASRNQRRPANIPQMQSGEWSNRLSAWELHDPSTSRPVAVVLEVDAAGQRRDVVAATVAPTAKVALPGVAAKMGGKGLEKEVAWVVGLCLLYRRRESSGWLRKDNRGRAHCLGRCKLGPNFSQEWFKPNASVRLRRTTGTRHNGPLIRSEQFRQPRTTCVGPLETPLALRLGLQECFVLLLRPFTALHCMHTHKANAGPNGCVNERCKFWPTRSTNKQAVERNNSSHP
jgi:hypothetical protein